MKFCKSKLALPRGRVNSAVGHLVIMDIESWSRRVAGLVLDRLIDEEFLKREDFDAALDPAAEEIQIRLAMGDYPDIAEPSASS